MSKNTDLGNLVNGLFVSSTRNVGIGTTTPTDRLEIQDGNLSTYHPVNLATAGYGINFYTNGGGSKNTIAGIFPSQVGTARSGNLLFYTSNSGALTERMRITSVGSVGINGNPGAFSNYVFFDIIGNSTTQGGLLQSRSSDDSTIGSFFANSNGLNVRTETVHPIIFSPSGVERMRITSSGNVGIGTSSPSAKLEVQQSTDNFGFGYSLKNIAGNTWQWVNGGDNNLYIGYNAATKLFVGTNGHVGIGTTAPVYPLHVTGTALLKGSGNAGRLECEDTASGGANITVNPAFFGTGTPVIQIQTNHPLLFATNNTDRGRITAGGNFLMGTSTDNGERLYVSGSIRATGSITANSDARLKKNIERIENALEKVGQISGYTYNTIYDEDRHAGLIAQEVELVLPEIVNSGTDTYKGIEYGNISALLVEAIKELSAEVQLLKNK